MRRRTLLQTTIAEQILDRSQLIGKRERIRLMTIDTHRLRALLALFAAAVLTAGLLALVETTPARAADRSFEPAPSSPIPVGTSPTTVTNADFNGDGKMDLAAQNSGSNSVSVRLGNGDGTFQAKPDVAVGLVPTSVISADFNSDGIADLAVTNQNSNNVSVLLGQDLDSDGKGDGTFRAKQDFAVGLHPSSVISANFNADGFADLAVANATSNTVSVLLGQDLDGDNKADGTFRAKQDFSIATETCNDFICTWDTAAPNQVISADFNGDTKVDLATANFGSCVLFCSGPGGVSVLLGNGDGTFQTYKLAKTNATNSSVPSIAAVDFNASGSLDLVATEYNSNVVSLLRGNGDGTFQTEQNLPVGSNPSAVTSAALDGDAKADDLAVSNGGSGNVSVLFNNGSGSFQAAQNFPAGNTPIFVVGADLNTDSFADLAVANQNSNNVSVLLNIPRPDTVAPITTRSLSPQPNAAGWNKEDVTVTLTATDNDSGVKEISYSINGGQITTVQQNSVQIPPITNEGETTISYFATDNADNVEAQQIFTVTLDKTRPPVPSTPDLSATSDSGSSSTDDITRDTTPTFSGTAEADSTIRIFAGTALVGSATANSSGAYQITTSGALSQGNHTITATATDAAGNTSSSSGALSIKIDNSAPDTTIASGGPTGYVKSTSASFSFSGTDNLTPAASLIFECNRDGPIDENLPNCTSPKSYTGLSQGSHTFRVTAKDQAGNIDASPATRSWFVDTVVPKGTISISGGAASTSSRTVTLRLSASDPAPGSGVASMRFRNGGTTTWTSWVAYATSKSWTLTAGAGTKTVYVQYRDRAGNISAAASDTIRFSP